MAGRRQKKGQTASMTPLPLAIKKLTKAAVYRILASLAEGGTLLNACKSEKVSYRNTWDVLKAKYQQEYAMAKECSTNALVDLSQERALGSTSETAAGDRVQIDFVKWLAARRSPGDYGDKQTVVMEKDERIIIDTGTWIAPTGSDDITIPALEAENDNKADAPD